MNKVKEIKLSVISEMRKKQNGEADEDDENKKEKKENDNKNNNIDLQIAGFNKNQNVIQIS